MESILTPLDAALGALPRSTEANTQKSFIITTNSKRARSSNMTLLSRRMQLRIQDIPQMQKQEIK